MHIDFWMGRPDDALRAASVAMGLYGEISRHALVASLRRDILRTLIAYRTAEVGRLRLVANEAKEAAARAKGVLPPGLPVRLARTDVLVLEGDWDAVDQESTEYAILEGNRADLMLDDEALQAQLSMWRGKSGASSQVIAAILPDGPGTMPDTIGSIQRFSFSA